MFWQRLLCAPEVSMLGAICFASSFRLIKNALYLFSHDIIVLMGADFSQLWGR